MTIKIEIVLTSGSDGTFYPGQEVSGEVLVVLTKTIKVSRIKLAVYGVGVAEWSEPIVENARFLNLEQFLFQTNNDASNVAYFGKERYMYSELILCKVNDFVPAGGYTYGFACPLPENIPASFEGTDGYIRYTILATVERPWKQSKIFTQNFQISRHLDLNNESLFPIKAEHTKSIGCWPCLSTGHLSLSVQLPSNGFVPGQIISTHIQVHCRRNIKIRSVTTVLIQRTIYNARAPKPRQRIENQVVCKNVSAGIRMPEGGAVAEDQLQVPWMLPTSCNSKIIKICYELKVALELDTCFLQDPHAIVTIPVVIGTVAERDASELSECESIQLWPSKT
ncbi:hypothetical protein quinque_016090 [Culex quinquefasciatus]|uniref:arrestin domain-containing protein 17 n=1 Tax=Culex quinquefasciatus TaxID=7176 RepID=UPI0018E2CCF6|nr:arrestin domain-containing protein 17 [Culex quinquefasciatus]